MSSPTNRIIQLPVAELVEDMTIYPRHAIDETHVAQLVKALRAGAQFPPLVVDAHSKKIADGWHRARAYRRYNGADVVVDVELKPYANEQELLLDAIKLNSAHGKILERIDQIRCTVLASRVGIDEEQVAIAMHRTVEEVKRLSIRVATVPGGSSTAVPGTNYVVLKRPVRHMEGATLTEEQAEAMRTVPGTSYLLIAQQLYEALHLRLVNRSDERLLEELRRLKDELVGYLQ